MTSETRGVTLWYMGNADSWSLFCLIPLFVSLFCEIRNVNDVAAPTNTKRNISRNLDQPQISPSSKDAGGTTSPHDANALKAGLGLWQNYFVNLLTFAKIYFSSIWSLLCPRQQEIKQNCKRSRYSNRADRSHLLHRNTRRCTCNMNKSTHKPCWN